MEESWKGVVGYEDLFLISNQGRLFSKRTNKIMKQFLHKNGYCYVATKIGGRKGVNKTFKIHRLVAEAFLDPPEKQVIESSVNTYYKVVIVNHKDCDKTNNNVGNLEWCTYQENSDHARENSLFDFSMNSGANNLNSFFNTEGERKSAYYSFIESGLSMRKFAATLGTSHQVIMRVVRDYGNIMTQ